MFFGKGFRYKKNCEFFQYISVIRKIYMILFYKKMIIYRNFLYHIDKLDER